MFRLINLLGKFVVKAYFNHATNLHRLSEAEGKLAGELSAKADKAMTRAISNADASAEVAYKAQQLSKFF